MGIDKQSASHFKALFIARTTLARERAGKSQEKLAAELGISQPTYTKYESRTPLPHYLVPQFCMLCKVTTEWMYSAAVEIKIVKPRRRRQKKMPKAA